jgi:ketosteroid isomerase-like protein
MQASSPEGVFHIEPISGIGVKTIRSRSAAATVNCMTNDADHSTDEADIRRQIQNLAEAIRALDLETVMSVYKPDIVSFDIEPPLQHRGADAKRRNWERVFAAYQRPLGYEIRELTVTVSKDVAFALSLNRLSGTLKTGATTTGFWVRATTCFQRVGGHWFIAHDHVSTPLEVTSGAALLNLEP